MSQHKNTEIWQSCSAPGDDGPRAVLGVDIGGTGIKWAVYELKEDEKTQKIFVTKNSIARGSIPTPRGVGSLIRAYSAIFQQAVEAAAGHTIVGVGAGTPGRLIRRDKTARAHSGKIDALVEHMPWKPSRLGMFSPGSALKLWEEGKLDEFRHVAIESVLQRATPRGIQVKMENDAVVQMQGLAETLGSNGARPQIHHKKLFYFAPGTGLGTGVRSRDSKVLAYGFYQEMRLPKRSSEPYDSALFDLVRKRYAAAYAVHTDEPVIEAEHLLSGSGLGEILSAAMGRDITSAQFDAQYVPGKQYHTLEMQTAIGYLKAAGRYMGDMLVRLHQGDFQVMNPERDMGRAYHKAPVGFDTLLIGGGAGSAKFYSELVLPEARKILRRHGLEEKIAILAPKNPNMAATYAAACLVSAEALRQKKSDIEHCIQENGWRRALHKNEESETGKAETVRQGR